MPLECSVPLTDDAWTGLPLRIGRFPGRGRMEGVVADHDAVLVWSGGRSDVTLLTEAGRQAEPHHFVRDGGMIDLLPKGIVFHELAWEGEPCTCVRVCFESEAVARLLGKNVAFEPGIVRTALTDAHLVDLVQRLQAQWDGGQPWGPLYVEALSLTLASYVHGRYGSKSRDHAPTEQLSRQDLQRLTAFVDEHLARGISLKDLADLVGYSPDHLSRLFKRAIGVTPYQYILDRRVERVKTLLRDRSLSIAKIALRCGFASQAHLNVTFKARTGVTPGAYRSG